MASLRGLLVSLLAASTTALPWIGPAATPLVGTNEKVDQPRTTAAALTNRFRRRDSYPVSVCGWIAGVASLQASCSTQSSCVWNTDLGVVGCCAMTSDGCAFYTSCVDINSKKPSVDRNDVYTCRGTSVCYLNTYPHGLVHGYDTAKSFQIVFTGTSSNAKATTSVATEYTTLTLTVTPSIVSTTPTTLTTSTQGSSTDDSSGATSSTTTTSSTGAEASSDSPTPSASAEPAPKGTPTGAIAGGTVGGFAGVAILATILFFFWRKYRRGNDEKEERQGEVVMSVGGPIAELESPKPSPAPVHDISAISSPTIGRYSNASTTRTPGRSELVELP
ncbi:hypothetical protein LMH87_010654 [Akanthomyces muscarius]|uniref:Uncharacterized protein n=1 Tax=Akanthomyces muscarius TaxID=2231603 RepID=A0A9W8Q849_AKAMU|nr:hypothetical protein LMH87_010654 [Akanthomyces muscarius]KAJ4149876.1 hypothetical protein LMH87_010654 [Akanthomyces muscarius]